MRGPVFRRKCHTKHISNIIGFWQYVKELNVSLTSILDSISTRPYVLVLRNRLQWDLS